MSNQQHTPRGKQAKFDKRLHFVAKACAIDTFKVSAQIANDWYINNDAQDMSIEDALAKFKEWLPC